MRDKERILKAVREKVKLEEFIITKPLLYEMLNGLILEKEKIKTMNSKMTMNSQLPTTEPKTKQKMN